MVTYVYVFDEPIITQLCFYVYSELSHSFLQLIFSNQRNKTAKQKNRQHVENGFECAAINATVQAGLAEERNKPSRDNEFI